MSIAEKLTTIAENQQAVYDAGKDKEWNTFWDNYQKKGAKLNYTQAFYSNKWNDKNYKPKYPIICSSCSSMFNSSEITDTMVDIDISACSGAQYLFGYCTRLETVRKLIVSENVSYADSFASCRALKNIRFEGTIGKSIDFSSCPLTVESMIDVIRNLEHYRDTENAGKYTVKFSDSCWQALENSGHNVNEYIPDVTSWSDGVIYKGWNI